MQLVIESTGNIRCVYDEAIPLNSLGKLSIIRGSHVEPTAEGSWLADMGPVSGPVTRSQALAAERRWLEAHWLCADSAAAGR